MRFISADGHHIRPNHIDYSTLCSHQKLLFVDHTRLIRCLLVQLKFTKWNLMAWTMCIRLSCSLIARSSLVTANLYRLIKLSITNRRWTYQLRTTVQLPEWSLGALWHKPLGDLQDLLALTDDSDDGKSVTPDALSPSARIHRFLTEPEVKQKKTITQQWPCLAEIQSAYTGEGEAEEFRLNMILFIQWI